MATPKCSGLSYGSFRSAAKPQCTSPGAMGASGTTSSRKFEHRDAWFTAGRVDIIVRLSS